MDTKRKMSLKARLYLILAVLIVLIAFAGMAAYYSGMIEPLNEKIYADLQEADYLQISENKRMTYTILDGYKAHSVSCYLPLSFELKKDPKIASFEVKKVDDGKPYLLIVNDFNEMLCK